MSLKLQNQGIKLGQNCQIEFCSFQLMEGIPSISWQYFDMSEAFRLLAFGFNWCCVHHIIGRNKKIMCILFPLHLDNFQRTRLRLIYLWPSLSIRYISLYIPFGHVGGWLRYGMELQRYLTADFDLVSLCCCCNSNEIQVLWLLSSNLNRLRKLYRLCPAIDPAWNLPPLPPCHHPSAKKLWTELQYMGVSIERLGWLGCWRHGGCSP